MSDSTPKFTLPSGQRRQTRIQRRLTESSTAVALDPPDQITYQHLVHRSIKISRFFVGVVFLAAVAIQSRAAPEISYEKRLKSIPANVTFITEADIANSTARDVPSILQEAGGLYVYDIEGNGQGYRLGRSGFGAETGINTLVLVDGRRINNHDYGEVDWTSIPLDRVARIEIVRGSHGSVLYGDKAGDGIINIITKGGTPGFRYGIGSGGGSYNTLESSAYVTGTYHGVSYAVSGRRQGSDGYRDNSAIKQSDFDLNLDYGLGEIAHIGLNAGYHEGTSGLPGGLKPSDLAAGFRRRDSIYPLDIVDKKDYYLQLKPELYFLKNSAIKMPLSYRNQERRVFHSDKDANDSPHTDIGTIKVRDINIGSITVSPQVVLGEAISGFDNRLTLGFDYHHAQLGTHNRTKFVGHPDVPNTYRYVDDGEMKRQNYGFYVHDAFSATDRLVVSAGYRWDRNMIRTDGGQMAGDPGKNPALIGKKFRLYYAAKALSAGLNYRFLDRSRVYLGYTRGFRYPTFGKVLNLYSILMYPQFRTQTTDSYELGIRHDFTDRLYGSLNLFRVDTNDKSVHAFGLYKDRFKLDVDKSSQIQSHGIEAAAGFDSRRFSLKGSFTYRDVAIRSGRVVELGRDVIPNVPRNQASLNLVWRPMAGLSLALNGVHVGARSFDYAYHRRTALKQNDYQVFNLKIKYAWQKYTTFLDINNVFNKTYIPYSHIWGGYTMGGRLGRYPAPELNLFAGLRFDY